MKTNRVSLGAKAVSLAISHHDLPPQRTLPCAGGCGRQAEQYHHYAGYEDWQLLDVIPLCRYCHSLADRIRNQEEVDRDRPEVQQILAAIQQAQHRHPQRRLYLLAGFQHPDYRCRYVVSRRGKAPAIILSDMDQSTFRDYLNSKQLKGVDLKIECALCDCGHGHRHQPCACPCHTKPNFNRNG